jgi:cytidyltransferase-like protein
MSKIVVASGYFNPIHIGHVRLFKEARSLGDTLVVIVNNDRQQMLKKGKIIMREEERMEVVKSVRYVDRAILSIDQDPTVCATLEYIAREYPGDQIIFANGGDRKDPSLIPETAVCEKYKIASVFGIGGNDKPNSSSNINKILGLE